MSSPKGPKSAFELAMEKLNARDRASGESPRKTLSDSQKARIAELRNTAKAEVAEWEILREQRLAETEADPVKHAEMQEKIDIDRRRIEETLKSRVAEIREES